MIPLDPRTVAHALGGEVSGTQIRCPGPGHSGQDRSLSVKLDPASRDGFVVHSFSGDDPLACRDYVRSKLGFSAREPAQTAADVINRRETATPRAHRAPNGHDPQPRNEGSSRKICEYVYKLANGMPYLRVDRYDPKSFPQYHWTGSGWATGKPQGPKIPYRLPEMLAAVHDTVFVCEGEKDADALTERGFVATTASEGAGKWTADLNPYFEGRTIYILADNDEQGETHAKQVAMNLSGVTSEVRIVRLSGLPEKGDVSDWIAAGGDLGTLVDLCQSFPVYEPDHNDHKPDHNRQVAAPVIRSAAELRRKEFPAVRFVVPGFLVEGCTLLAGRPKLGKSWLMLDIHFARA